MKVSAAAKERLIEILKENDEENTSVRISQITLGGG